MFYALKHVQWIKLLRTKIKTHRQVHSRIPVDMIRSRLHVAFPKYRRQIQGKDGLGKCDRLALAPDRERHFFAIFQHAQSSTSPQTTISTISECFINLAVASQRPDGSPESNHWLFLPFAGSDQTREVDTPSFLAFQRPRSEVGCGVDLPPEKYAIEKLVFLT